MLLSPPETLLEKSCDLWEKIPHVVLISRATHERKKLHRRRRQRCSLCKHLFSCHVHVLGKYYDRTTWNYHPRSDIKATASSAVVTARVERNNDLASLMKTILRFVMSLKKEGKFKVLKNVNDKKLMCLHSSNLSVYQMFEIFLLSLPREDDGMSSESYHITRYFLFFRLVVA